MKKLIFALSMFLPMYCMQDKKQLTYIVFDRKVDNNERLYTENGYIFKSSVVNNGSINAKVIKIEDHFIGGGSCLAEEIELGKDCLVFKTNLLNTATLKLNNKNTKLVLSPQATHIKALYKQDIYMGSIYCWLEKMNHGCVTITDYSSMLENSLGTPTIATHTFLGTWEQLSDALSEGISNANSLEELLKYLEKNLKKEVPQEKLKGSWIWTPLMDFFFGT